VSGVLQLSGIGLSIAQAMPLLAEQDIGGDEALLLIGSGITCFAGVVKLLRSSSISKLGAAPGQRLPLYMALLLSLTCLCLAARFLTAKEVRESGTYIVLVILLGGAQLVFTSLVFPWLGIGLRQDAFEGRNPAAMLALSGAFVGVALIYIGASVGEGPSFWNNIFGTALGLLTWFTLWLFLTLGAGVNSSVTEERDVATGARLAGFLISSGLVLARALAGDWHSAAATVHDFAREGWPALLLLVLAILVELGLRPWPGRRIGPFTTYGLIPAMLYLCLGIAWTLHLGLWETGS
jgi:uncharacterized membrane protein YjfL (UPF0719 family)